MGVIFVAGVYAVGKTTACTQAAQISGIPHFTASGLIKTEKSSAIPEHGKVVADIGGNQALLIRGVQRVLAENQHRIILDGHFTLPNIDGRIEAIDIEVFRAIDLETAIVYHDEPEAIAARLDARDGDKRSPSAIADHQRAELAHARTVASKLGVPLVLLAAFDSSGLIQAMDSMRTHKG